MLKLGVPGGRLQEPVFELFQRAGYDLYIKPKHSSVHIDDTEIECFLDRATEIADFVSRGFLDGGVTSNTAIEEKEAEVVRVREIGTQGAFWHPSRLIIGVAENSSIKSIKGLQGKKIITGLPRLTEKFLRQNKISASIEFSDVRKEPKVPAMADAVVEFTHTGATLDYFHIRVLATVKENANILYLVANSKALKDKRKRTKLENLGMLLKAARQGQEMVGLMMHAENKIMEKVLRILPSLKKPTVTLIRGENRFQVFSVAKEIEARDIIPKLHKIGCADIIEFPLNKVVIE